MTKSDAQSQDVGRSDIVSGHRERSKRAGHDRMVRKHRADKQSRALRGIQAMMRLQCRRNPQLFCATPNCSRCAADKPAAIARRALLLQIPPERPPTAAETRCAAREQPLTRLSTCVVTKSKSLRWTCNRRVGRKLHGVAVREKRNIIPNEPRRRCRGSQ